MAASAHADRNSDVWPQPCTVSSADLGSRFATVTAPWYGVAGSNWLPTTSTGLLVRLLNGPMYRSASVRSQDAQIPDAQVQMRPKYPFAASAAMAAVHQAS